MHRIHAPEIQFWKVGHSFNLLQKKHSDMPPSSILFPAQVTCYCSTIALCFALLSGCEQHSSESTPKPDGSELAASATSASAASNALNESLHPAPFVIPGLPSHPKLSCSPVFAPNAKHLYCMEEPKIVNSEKKATLWRWHPFSGKLEEFQLTLIFSPHNPEKSNVVEIGDEFVLFTDRLRLFASGNPIALDEVRDWVDETKPFKDTYSVGMGLRKIAVLPDQSIVTLPTYSNIVELISIHKDKLTYDRLPNLPGPKRGGVALVTLADGRVMALGGNVSEFMGCSPCVADTYILDVNKRAWSEGPKMTEPRSDAGATLMPNGNVLVTGGWTPGHGSGGWGVLSRTVEHWDPDKNVFIKNIGKLPTGVARHQTLLTTQEPGKQLLIAGGNSAAVHAYEIDSDVWRQAGEFCDGNERGNLNVITGDANGRQLVIRPPTSGKCYDSISNTVAQLRMSAVIPIDKPETVTLYRSGSAFLPGSGGYPSLILGGTVDAGMDNFTAAVDALWPDGRIQALPALNHARSNAQVFRLLDGSILLVGGHINEGNESLTIGKQYPAELLPGKLPLEQAHWIPLEGDWGKEQLVQLVDGSLFSLDSDGKVRIIRISGAAQSKPTVVIRELPVLHRARRHDSDNGRFQNITGKELPDGRIIVAGGNVQEHRIALLQENSSKNDSPDEYIGIGAFLPTDTYEIYDPATKSWRESAPSQGKGGLFATLEDGRVARFGMLSDEPLVEISSPDGSSWGALSEEKPLVRLEYDSNLFVEQGELFVAGKMEIANVKGGVASLRWYNASTRQWETIWQAEPATSWRNYEGQIIFRKLSNGKTVHLPVAGL